MAARQQHPMTPPQESQSRLADNILGFCRTLRKAGLPVGTGQVVDAVTAVSAVGLARRDDFYQALQAVLASDPRHFSLFRQAFHVYFRDPRLLEKMAGMLSPGPDAPALAPDVMMRRLLEALSQARGATAKDATLESDSSGTWSYREVLRHKDFDEMSLAEQSEARALLSEEIELLAKKNRRRFRPDDRGSRYDLRRSLQTMVRNHGQLIQLARRRRIERAPVLVMICDISGSMSRYSRMFLLFAHALMAAGQRMHCFVFGTRLTNITRRLRDADADRALAQVAGDVMDWDGGTRITDSLMQFNRDWGRRVLAQDAVVVLLSDGLERDSGGDLPFQMQRLRRSCRRLAWLNPMLRYPGFEAKAAGIRQMLPHVDDFLPAHNVDSLTGLVAVLSGSARMNWRGTSAVGRARGQTA
jgi:uncharacterized protein with von Willebrand factor type A (vWA) domain